MLQKHLESRDQLSDEFLIVSHSFSSAEVNGRQLGRFRSPLQAMDPAFQVFS